ncbi:MAG: ribosome recycling factor [Candidatus Omnitrophica bacterium]|nr:ribosome recycling factor [Candidatus Omnitrophota bacterium]
MELKALLSDIKVKMDKTIEALKAEFATLRTSRATPALVENIKVDYYGSSVPLKQIASITIPEPRVILVQPWDPKAISEIEKAFLKSELGVTPNNDGKMIRIILPALTEERRQDLVKLIRKISEDSKIAMRNVRRDANEGIKKLEKDSKITEDEKFKAQEEIQEITDNHIKKVDGIIAAKEKEVLEV